MSEEQKVDKGSKQEIQHEQSPVAMPSWQMDINEFNQNGCLINGD